MSTLSCTKCDDMTSQSIRWHTNKSYKFVFNLSFVYTVWLPNNKTTHSSLVVHTLQTNYIQFELIISVCTFEICLYYWNISVLLNVALLVVEDIDLCIFYSTIYGESGILYGKPFDVLLPRRLMGRLFGVGCGGGGGERSGSEPPPPPPPLGMPLIKLTVGNLLEKGVQLIHNSRKIIPWKTA